ncbi:MAG TPA: ThuA domain-containing protein [Candidatus Baltobacteraceae bacterium]|nr:ThuA domain-containing protein [Candidatus Baltobacteraceae bacterium]
MTKFLFLAAILFTTAIQAAPIRVLVWDENGKGEKAYTNFIAPQIASYLKTLPNLSVQSAGLNDTNLGLSDDAISNCDVLVYWSHVRNKLVPDEKVKQIVERVKDGKMSLVILHSALTSKVFIEAMNERTREDVAKTIPAGTKTEFILPVAYKDPLETDPITPRVEMRTNWPEQVPLALVYLPICEITHWRETGESVTIKTVSNHPIAKDVPAEFEIPHTEVYSEPFHVPKPDEVIFEEHSQKGEIFRAGMLWNVGKGKVFYFGPGHETFPIYFQPEVLRVIGNAVEWLGTQTH